ncbi:uncharacterized protein TNCV_1437181 [Trichonephila clavipes]|nr:uncharacterized protein TNCV_1437181 [Trichonephila clavipes]
MNVCKVSLNVGDTPLDFQLPSSEFFTTLYTTENIKSRFGKTSQGFLASEEEKENERDKIEFNATDQGTLVRIPRCNRRRRIDEADISTPVAVDQRAFNCLEEAVRSFTRCRSSHADVIFRRPLPVFRVVRCSSVHCFQIRITVELFRCT